MFYDQSEFDVRCEWGMQGVEKLSPISDVVIIVDVMSFSTCVDIAVHNGAIILPYRWKDDTAVEYARLKNAQLASFKRRFSGQFSLSPSSLVGIAANTKLVLPSPNGSTLTLASMGKHTLAGCLRNCLAVAEYTAQLGGSVAVIPAGERWEDGTLRPAIEDLIGAGAIISYLKGTKSPEARAALSVFKDVQHCLDSALFSCSSGKELTERGFSEDVKLVAQFNCSNAVPKLRDGAYLNQSIIADNVVEQSTLSDASKAFP